MKLSALIKQLQVMEKLYKEQDVDVLHIDMRDDEDACAMEVVSVEKDGKNITLYIQEA